MRKRMRMRRRKKMRSKHTFKVVWCGAVWCGMCA
jgi:hypothetical protein